MLWLMLHSSYYILYIHIRPSIPYIVGALSCIWGLLMRVFSGTGNAKYYRRIWRPKLAEHFPTTKIAIIGIRLFCNFPRLLRAIECKMAILLVYLSLLYVEKKQRYKLLNTHENAQCDSEIGNVSFA